MTPKPHESATPTRNHSPDRRRKRPRWTAPSTPDVLQADEEYRVGPGRPPKQFQFKPGQSGNPKGAKRKSKSIAPDLKALLEHALSEKMTFRRGEKELMMTKAAAGIERLVTEFALGDRHARRDLIALAGKLGFDLTESHASALEKALAAKYSVDDQALVDDYVQRRFAELSQLSSDSDVQLTDSLDATDDDNSKRSDGEIV